MNKRDDKYADSNLAQEEEFFKFFVDTANSFAYILNCLCVFCIFLFTSSFDCLFRVKRKEMVWNCRSRSNNISMTMYAIRYVN